MSDSLWVRRMNKQELQTLRGQLLLMGALFAGCIVAAIVMASQREFFEKFVEEKYVALPASLKPLADAAAEGTIDKKAFANLSDSERLALYDYWMTHSDPTLAGMPRALVAADPPLYLTRAERSLVCGRVEQKLKALTFLELAGSRDAIPILQKVSQWAARRQIPEIAAKIAETIDRIERIAPQGPFSETSPNPAQ